MMRSSSLVTALLGSLHILYAQGKPAVVLESIQTLPDGWALASKPPMSTLLSVSIALAQPKLADLEGALLQQATSRASPSTFSSAQVRAFQAPAGDAAANVISWLVKNGAPGAVQDGPWVKVNATVEALHSLFDADIAYYTYNSSNDADSSGTEYTVLRTRSYSVPASLSSHVDFVFPLAHFMPPTNSHQLSPQGDIGQPKPRQRRRSRTKPGSDNSPIPSAACVPNTVTPDCIRDVYGWPLSSSGGSTDDPPSPSTSPVRFGIAGFLDEYINYEDVAEFLKTYVPSLSHSHSPQYNFTVELVGGGANVQTPRSRAGMEASLDVQYAMALAYPAQIVYYSTGGRGDQVDGSGKLLDSQHSDNEPYLSLLEYLVALPDDRVPHVLSISYSDDEQSVPQPYAVRVCQLFMQLAARGTTVLVASGDGGSRGIGRNACRRNDGSGERALLPTFPASCPWVTAVGATNAPVAVNADDLKGPSLKKVLTPPAPSMAADYSSGGFSNYFSRPTWQDRAVSAYVPGHAGQDKQGLFNASGRAVPDMSAMGSKFQVVWGGAKSSADGTSASTPLVASMVAMANDARLRAGKPVLGWLNPTLYSDGVQAVLQDITEGVSKGCPFDETNQAPGWPATSGWDAVTGLGVPSDYSSFIKALAEV